jgi:UDP-2-acetamido-2-deoxy-ribo-hexuluronate aminotransferase
MHKIQMVDLKRQYLKVKEEIDTAIHAVIDSTAFINGPAVKEFSQDLEKYLDVKHVIPCANGTDALQIAMMALGFEPGDEVITPSFTYIATVEVMGLLHIKPVFVDVDEHTFTLKVDEIEALITPKTKAIVAVHLYGQSADMEPLLALAKKHNLIVLEDNAQAIGGSYTFSDGTKKANGTMGLIGCTSFFPSKNLGCYGDGGAMYTNDDDIAAKLRMVANHGQVVRYYHEVVGCNSRLDTIQAAVLKVKLQHLDAYCDARRTVADYYDAAFANHPNINTPFRASYSHHVYHQYTITLNNVDRDAVVKAMEERGIPTMVYYPVPSHKQNMFKSFNVGNLVLPITDKLTPNVISLPIHTELSQEELQFITTNFLEVINTLKK